MAKVSVYNIEGKEVDTIELNDAVFGVEVHTPNHPSPSIRLNGLI